MHKITSSKDNETKIWRQKFWSHGTPLGSSGSGSQEALPLGFCKLQFLVIWGPLDPPVLVALLEQAKIPKPTAALCVLKAFV